MQHIRLHKLLGLKGARLILKKNCALNALLMQQNLEEQVRNQCKLGKCLQNGNLWG